MPRPSSPCSLGPRCVQPPTPVPPCGLDGRRFSQNKCSPVPPIWNANHTNPGFFSREVAVLWSHSHWTSASSTSVLCRCPNIVGREVRASACAPWQPRNALPLSVISRLGGAPCSLHLLRCTAGGTARTIEAVTVRQDTHARGSRAASSPAVSNPSSLRAQTRQKTMQANVAPGGEAPGPTCCSPWVPRDTGAPSEFRRAWPEAGGGPVPPHLPPCGRLLQKMGGCPFLSPQFWVIVISPGAACKVPLHIGVLTKETTKEGHWFCSACCPQVRSIAHSGQFLNGARIRFDDWFYSLSNASCTILINPWLRLPGKWDFPARGQMGHRGGVPGLDASAGCDRGCGECMPPAGTLQNCRRGNPTRFCFWKLSPGSFPRREKRDLNRLSR